MGLGGLFVVPTGCGRLPAGRRRSARANGAFRRAFWGAPAPRQLRVVGPFGGLLAQRQQKLGGLRLPILRFREFGLSTWMSLTSLPYLFGFSSKAAMRICQLGKATTSRQTLRNSLKAREASERSGRSPVGAASGGPQKGRRDAVGAGDPLKWVPQISGSRETAMQHRCLSAPGNLSS